jgi:galactonate dehydratase
MKITKLETILCQAGGRNWVFVKVTTDDGIYGLGEGSLYGKEQAMQSAIWELEREILGEDPFRIEHLFQKMYRQAFWRGGPVLTSAISGVEMALWDIKGKALGVPVYELLGGYVRDEVRFYCNLGDGTPETLTTRAKKWISKGVDAFKIYPFPPVKLVDNLNPLREAEEKIAAVRELGGKNIDIMIDFHGRLSPTMAIQAEEIMRPYGPLFIEEPVLPENVDGLAKVARHAKIPIATGERLYTRWGLREHIEKELVSVVQPDLCHCGGIFEGRKIAAMAEAHFMSIAPHNPYGPVAAAACIQLDFATPNFLIQEHIFDDEPWRDDVYTPTLELVNGRLKRPTAPGLGIELVMDEIAKHPYEAKDQVKWTHPDGSLADY